MAVFRKCDNVQFFFSFFLNLIYILYVCMYVYVQRFTYIRTEWEAKHRDVKNLCISKWIWNRQIRFGWIVNYFFFFSSSSLATWAFFMQKIKRTTMEKKWIKKVIQRYRKIRISRIMEKYIHIFKHVLLIWCLQMMAEKKKNSIFRISFLF